MGRTRSRSTTTTRYCRSRIRNRLNPKPFMLSRLHLYTSSEYRHSFLGIKPKKSLSFRTSPVVFARRNMEDTIIDKVSELLETADWEVMTERKLKAQVGRELKLDVEQYSPLIKVDLQICVPSCMKPAFAWGITGSPQARWICSSASTSYHPAERAESSPGGQGVRRGCLRHGPAGREPSARCRQAEGTAR